MLETVLSLLLVSLSAGVAGANVLNLTFNATLRQLIVYWLSKVTFIKNVEWPETKVYSISNSQLFLVWLALHTPKWLYKLITCPHCLGFHTSVLAGILISAGVFLWLHYSVALFVVSVVLNLMLSPFVAFSLYHKLTK